MYSKPSPSARSTPGRASRSRRGTTPLAEAGASGSRQLRSTRGKLESNAQGNDGPALPSVQGVFSSSYGAPGMADLPDILVHNPTRTLADAIDAGLQGSNARASALVKDFQREFTKSPSPESQVSHEVSAPPSRAPSEAIIRTRPLPPLVEEEEQEEQEDDEEEEEDEEDEQEEEEFEEQHIESRLPKQRTGGNRPSNSSANGTVSFVQERVTHATTTIPVHLGRTPKRRNSAYVRTDASYTQTGALVIIILFLVSASVFGFAAFLGGEKSAALCRRLPIFSRFCDDFAFGHNPHLSVGDRKLAEKTQENYSWMSDQVLGVHARADGLTTEFRHFIASQNDRNADQHKINKDHAKLNTILTGQQDRLLHLWGYFKKSTQGTGEWYYDQVNHFDPGNGAIVLPKATSSTYTAITSPWQALVNFFIGRHLPRPPGAAISQWSRAGDCWCADIASRKRSWGQLGVRTLKEIWPTTFILDHLPKTASLDPSATPKDIELWAYVPSEKGQSTIRNLPHFAALNTEPDHFFSAEWVRIMNGTYDNTKFHVQFFDINYPRFEETSARDFAVRTTSNYGKETHTCLYSVMLRGEAVYPKGPAELDGDI